MSFISLDAMNSVKDNERTVGEEINFICTAGLTGQSIGLSTEPTQVSYPQGSTLGAFSESYAVGRDSIGEGTFGVVYPCCHRKSDTKCVVNCLNQSSINAFFLEEHRDRDMFTKLLKMSDPNVVRYLDFLMGPATVYTIMEALEGEELLDRITSTSVTEDFCRDVTRQVLSALKYVHNLLIIHRDVKLNGIRFRGSGPNATVVLFDFGHCCHQFGDLAKGTNIAIVGTALYIAPEVFSTDKCPYRYTPQVDIWALGVIVYVMLTGKAPFDFKDGTARAVSPQVALAAPEVQALPRLPLDLLKKLLVEDPTQRPDASVAFEHKWFSSSCADDNAALMAMRHVSTRDIFNAKAKMYKLSMPAVERRHSLPAFLSFEVEDANHGDLLQLAKSWHPDLDRTGSENVASFALAAVAQAAGCMDVIYRPQGLTFNEAVMTMVINCVGAGVVLFPKIMTDVGILIAPLLCIICATTCHQCGVMITSACDSAEEYSGTPIRTYEALATFSAPKLKFVLLITKNCAFMGFVVAYMQLIIDSIATFFENGTEWKTQIRFAVVLPCFCFLAMIKNLKQLAKFSSLGIAMVIIECGAIMVGGVILMVRDGPIEYSPLPTVAMSELPEACGKYTAIFLFSFAILGTVPTVRSQLETPSEMHAILSRSFMILVGINCVVMTCGYLGFGKKCTSNVVIGIADEYPILGYLASSAVIIGTFLGAPLFIFCVMSTIECSGCGAISTQMSTPNILFRVMLVVVLCLVGDQLPYVGEVIGLVASVFGCCNNIFFPAVFHYFARQKVERVSDNPCFRLIKYYGALAVGLCVLIFGFKGSLEALLFKLERDRLAGLPQEDIINIVNATVAEVKATVAAISV